jgi:hypothetical protein
MFSFRPFCFSKTFLGMTKSFQLCLLRCFSAFRWASLMTGSPTDLLSSTGSFVAWTVEGAVGAVGSSGREGLEGDPRTGSRAESRFLDSLEEVEEVVPNFQPPESRLPCFFDRDPRRRRVEVVVAANPLEALLGGLGLGMSGTGMTELALGCREFESGRGNPCHSSPSQADLVRGAGRADTGLIFFLRRGVRSTSTSSPSGSVSLPEVSQASLCRPGVVS